MISPSRIVSIFVARNREFFRDRAAMAWNFLFPVLVVTGFSLAFSKGSADIFKVAVVGTSSAVPELQEFQEIRHIQFVNVVDSNAAQEKLRHHQFDLVVAAPSTGQVSYWVNNDSPKGYLVEKLLRGSLLGATLSRGEVTGKPIRYIDWLISGLIGMNMMFSAMFGVGYVLIRYRKSGYLKRLKATPLKPIEFLIAQVASRMAIVVVVSSLVYVLCNTFAGFRMLGSYVTLFSVLCAGSLAMVSLGLVIASAVRSEELANGLLNLLTWPMMFLSGVWFSLEGASPWVQAAAQWMPLTHFVDAARAVMTEGAGLPQIGHHLVILAASAIVFLGVSAATFVWDND